MKNNFSVFSIQSLLDYGRVGEDSSCFGVIIGHLKHNGVDRKDFLAHVSHVGAGSLAMTDVKGVS